MKKFLTLLLVCFLITEAYSQLEYRTKNRYRSIDMDESIDGIWGGPDAKTLDVSDSVYIYKTGVPDYGDLYVPDLELKMKSLWDSNMVYFLFRHLDDSLVNGYINNTPDNSVNADLKNRDATAIYFFLDSSYARLDSDNPMYNTDSSYLNSIAWFRWVWGANEFEGIVNREVISSISDLGGEILQWKDGIYRYTKLSVNLSLLSVIYDTLEYKRLGFEIELNENDKELPANNGTYKIQTRAFWGTDLDSAALAPRNVRKWSWLYFTYGDSCLTACDKPTFIKVNTVNFANIYPNPASKYITVQLETSDEVEFKIFDLMGRIVKTGILVGREEIIELNSINTGTYYIQLLNKKGSLMTNKLLILR